MGGQCCGSDKLHISSNMKTNFREMLARDVAKNSNKIFVCKFITSSYYIKIWLLLFFYNSL